MQYATNRSILRLSLALLTISAAACDEPVGPESLTSNQEGPSFLTAPTLTTSGTAELAFVNGVPLSLRVGNSARLVSTATASDTQFVTVRIEAATNVVMYDATIGGYRSLSNVLRVGILSEPNFDATKITGEGLVLVVNESRLQPMRMATTGLPMRSITDRNADGRLDATFTFDASRVGTLPKFNKMVVLGWLSGFGNFRGGTELLRYTAWSSSNPAVVSVDATGLATAATAGTATIRYSHAAGVDSATMTVLAATQQISGTNSLAGIDATGVKDVTQALLAYFASVPDGSVIRFPAGARYRIEGVLLLRNRRNLTFEGNGATFFATTNGSGVAPPIDTYRPNWPRKREHFAFIGGGGIKLRNLTIRGAHLSGGVSTEAYVESLEGQHGISFMSVQGVELDRVRITDVYGDFLYLGGQRGEWSKNVHVHDSHFQRNGRQGIAITGAEDVLVENNYMGDVRRTAIDVEPNGDLGGTRRFTLRNNTFGDIRLTFFAGHGRQGYVDDVTIEGNRLLASGLKILTDSTATRPHRNWKVVGNVSEASIGSPVPPIRLWHMEGVAVRDNVQRMNPDRRMTGVQMSASCAVSIGGNQFTGSVAEYVIENPRVCTVPGY